MLPIPWQAVSAKLSPFGRLQLFGAFVPGVIVLTELWIAVQPHAEVVRAGGLLQHASNQTSTVDEVVLAIAIVLFAVSALALGYLSRELAWPVMEKLGGWRKTTSVERRAKLDTDYGVANVEQALARHPALTVALASGHDFGYSKLWLRTHSPVLAVDHLETEINGLMALVTPVALMPLVTWRVTEDWWWAGSITVAVVLAVMTIARKARALNDLERAEGARNVLFAEWFDASRPESRVTQPS